MAAVASAVPNEPPRAARRVEARSRVFSTPAPELSVKPWRVFGTGRPDASPQAVNPPDGLAFTRDGLLLATDAQNHRVQVFDPVSGSLRGSLGGPDVFAGEVGGIAVAPDGGFLVSDEVSNQAHRFRRVCGGGVPFALAGPPLLGREGFRRLTGIAYDAAGRLYAIDGKAGEVRRYLPDLTPDPCWTFQGQRPDGKPMLTWAEGVAIDESRRTVFLASEHNGMVHAYDLETGCWLGKTIGQRIDPASGVPVGQSVFSISVEGLAILGDYLLAVDEGSDKGGPASPGKLLLFDLSDPAVYQTDFESCRARLAAGRPAGLVGWIGEFLSPDGVAAFPGRPGGPEPLVAVADQGHYRVLVYRGEELLRAARAASARENP